MENRKKLTSVLNRRSGSGLQLGKLIRVCRSLRGWSIEKTARSVGVSEEVLRQLENGSSLDLKISAKTVKKLGGPEDLAIRLCVAELLK